MNLKSLMKKEVISTMAFPNHESFKVTLRYLDKDTMKKIMEDCSKTTFDYKTKRGDKKMDEDKLKNFIADKLIVNWEGLNFSILAKIAPVDIPEGTNMDAAIEPTLQNKIDLLDMSNDFDTWVSEIIKEYGYFDEDKKEKEIENLK